MKVLHAAALLRPAMGIVNQMHWEQAAANELGLEWHTRLFCPIESVVPSSITRFSNRVHADRLEGFRNTAGWWSLRREYHAWLREQRQEYDVFLLRYYPHDPFQMQFVRSSRKPVFLVHHTLEGPELASLGGLAGPVRALLDHLMFGATLRAATGVIGVTEEIVAYELKRAATPGKLALVYPNGIVYQESVLPDKRGEVPELLFVASSFAPWHGLDLLLKSVQCTKDDFILHLVGDISEAERRVAEDDPRVRVHGRLGHAQIISLAAGCAVGLSSFALFRNKMTQACTLKVREYLMLGLPVYSGHKDVFPEDFPYYCCGPCDMSHIIEFTRYFVDRSRETIAIAAKPYINKSSLLVKLIAGIKRDVVV